MYSSSSQSASSYIIRNPQPRRSSQSQTARGRDEEQDDIVSADVEEVRKPFGQSALPMCDFVLITDSECVQVEVVEGVAGEEDHHDDQEEQGEEPAEAEGQHDEHDEDGKDLLLSLTIVKVTQWCVSLYALNRFINVYSVFPGSDMELDLLAAAETESDSESNHSNQDNASGRRSVVTAATAGSEAGTDCKFELSVNETE